MDSGARGLGARGSGVLSASVGPASGAVDGGWGTSIGSSAGSDLGALAFSIAGATGDGGVAFGCSNSPPGTES